MPDILIHVIASAAYVGLAWHFWNTRWRRANQAARAAPGTPGLSSWERAAILVPLVLHGWLLYDGIFAAAELRFGFAQALSVMMWLGVAIYWVESLFYSLSVNWAAPIDNAFTIIGSGATYYVDLSRCRLVGVDGWSDVVTRIYISDPAPNAGAGVPTNPTT